MRRGMPAAGGGQRDAVYVAVVGGLPDDEVSAGEGRGGLVGWASSVCWWSGLVSSSSVGWWSGVEWSGVE